jgi:hypothetical protein
MRSTFSQRPDTEVIFFDKENKQSEKEPVSVSLSEVFPQLILGRGL